MRRLWGDRVYREIDADEIIINDTAVYTYEYEIGAFAESRSVAVDERSSSNNAFEGVSIAVSNGVDDVPKTCHSSFAPSVHLTSMIYLVR